jgi:DNA-binding GntR family transcriptional regulator
LLEVRYVLRPRRARESPEPVTASGREAEALNVAEDAPLMQVERTACARSGLVVWMSELPTISELTLALPLPDA